MIKTVLLQTLIATVQDARRASSHAILKSAAIKILCNEWPKLAVTAKELLAMIFNRIRWAAFECLVSISSMYYPRLPSYFEEICSITAEAIKSDEEHVAL